MRYCCIVRHKSLRSYAQVREGKLSLKDILNTIIEIREDQRTIVKDFNTSNETLSDKLAENTEAIEQ